MSSHLRTEHPGAEPTATAVTDVGTLSIAGRVLVGLISVWRWTSAWRAPRCRFTPTCSAYAIESIRVHGAVRGGWRAVRRLGRCHPWNPGGVDPVT